MNKGFIMLGSNSDAEKNIETAIEEISGYYEIVSMGTSINTKAFGEQYKNNFTNKAIGILSDETIDITRNTLKQIEINMGRTSESKKNGIIPIDIDLIIWNEKIIHRDYERFDFVQKAIDEIKNITL